MWYPRGKFTGVALFAAIFLFAVGEWIFGIVASAIALVLHLVFGGTWRGFVGSVVILLAAIGLISIFYG